MAEDAVCAGFFRAAEGAKISCLDQFQEGNLIDGLISGIRVLSAGVSPR